MSTLIHRIPPNNLSSTSMQSPGAENDVFSTPPSTPREFLVTNTNGSAEPDIRPSLTRKSSRPLSSLHIAHFATGDIELDQNLPLPRPPPQFAPPTKHSKIAPSQPAETLQTSPSAASSSSESPFHVANSLASPYFVHSNLENGHTLGDFLKTRTGNGVFADLGVSKSLQSPMIEYYKPRSLQHTQNADAYEDDDDESSVSLTKHLAETAVGVREMSKQLGRARIKSNIQSILIVTKARDNRLIKLTRELALYLMLKKGQNGRGPIVYVDHQLRTSRRFDAVGIEREYPELFTPFPRRRSSSSTSVASLSLSTLSSLSSADASNTANMNEEGQLRYWTSDMCSRSPHLFDFVVTLGGDGTVLFTSWLFQRIVPPVLPFALGSLGFLTNFDFADHASVMDNVIDNGIRVNLRMRFTCTVYRAVRGPEGERKRKAVKKGDTGEIMMRNVEKGGWEALEGGTMHEHRPAKDKEIMCFTTRPVESFEVLNDLVIDRGPSPYVSMLELFGDEHHMTTVQGDGLTISTPTGSTAYSLSAGGSLVHPEIPAILITPIAPHTLSFRPMLLPDSMEVRVCVPFNSRSTAWVSFDGRGRVELKQGDHIKVTASKYPFPTVCHDKQSTDWFHAISRTLKWNDRERQKSFVVVEEGPEKKKAPVSPNTKGGGWEDDLSGQDEEDENGEDEVDEKFDIDDLSSENKPEESVAQSDVARNTSTATLDMACSKAFEQHADNNAAHRAAEALLSGRAIPGNQHRSGLHSGVDSPSRYIAGSPPHLPPAAHPQSARHVHFPHQPAPRPHNGTHTHAPSSGGGPLRDDARTPTAAEHRHRSRSRGRARVESSPAPQPRAFAVFGADESDSAPSDTES